MTCVLCQRRGKTWEGSDPRCAFESGVFDTNNWNCATMNALRDIAYREKQFGYWYRDDNLNASIGIVHARELRPGTDDDLQGYLVMTWYKDRGRTGQAWLMDDDDVPRPIAQGEAEAFLRMYSEENNGLHN